MKTGDTIGGVRFSYKIMDKKRQKLLIHSMKTTETLLNLLVKQDDLEEIYVRLEEALEEIHRELYQ